MPFLEDYNNLAYKFRVQNNALNYDTRSMTLKEFLDTFNKNKKFLTVKYPLRHPFQIENNLMMLLIGQGLPFDFVIKSDWSMMIGYSELKAINRWVNKDYSLRYDGVDYKYKDMPTSFKERFENSTVRIRVYETSVNINSIIRLFYGDAVQVVRS